MKNIIRCIGKLVPDTNKTYNLLYCIAAISLFFTIHAFADTPAEIKTDSKKAEESSIIYSDTRLNQKVTYSAQIKPVHEVLSDLAAMTGVTFYCGSNSKDWLVRDRKLIIFVKDVPLGSLKESIARVLKMKWKDTDDEGKLSYRLIQDQKALTDEEKRQKKIIDAARNEHYKRSKQALDNMINTANMSPSQLENLRETEPYLYLLVTTGIANFAKTLVNEVPAAGTALLGGEHAEISNSQITPNVRRSIEQALDGSARVFSSVMKADSKAINGFKNNLSDISISINNKFNYTEGLKYSVGGYVVIRMGNKTKYFQYFPKPKTFDSFASAVLKSQEQSANFFDILGSMSYTLSKAYKDNLFDTDTTEKPIEHPDDPLLLKDIQIKDKYSKFREYLSELSNEANINIVSDSFGYYMRASQSKRIAFQKASIFDYLESVGSRFNENWDKKDNIIEYRNKEWFKKRALLIPDELLNAWKDKFAATGTLDIEDLSQMAQLGVEKCFENIYSDELLNNSDVFGRLSEIFDILTFYAQMTNQQKQILFSNHGILIKSTDEDIEMPYALRGYNFENNTNSNNSIYLTGSVQPIDGCYKYIFTFKNGDSKTLLEQTMYSPKYQLPVEKVKPEDKKTETKPDQNSIK